MTAEELYQAFAFPRATKLGKRVFKKLFVDSGDITAADKRAFTDIVGTITWQYTLKPATIPVRSYRDGEREYDEIAVLEVEVESRQRAARLTEIIHRAIPYPLLLVLADGEGVKLSAAPKRVHRAERERLVAEYFASTSWLDGNERSPAEHAFLASLPLSGLPSSNYRVLYDAVLHRIVALECSELSGAFRLYSEGSVADRRAKLGACRALEREIGSLRATLRAEASFARKLELNTEIKRLSSQLRDHVSEL